MKQINTGNSRPLALGTMPDRGMDTLANGLVMALLDNAKPAVTPALPRKPGSIGASRAPWICARESSARVLDPA